MIFSEEIQQEILCEEFGIIFSLISFVYGSEDSIMVILSIILLCFIFDPFFYQKMLLV